MTRHDDDAPFFRHIAACNDHSLPDGLTRVWLDGRPVGWASVDTAAWVSAAGVAQDEHGLHLTGQAQLDAVARSGAEAGRYRWRGEAFDIRARPRETSCGTIDRGALPAFGMLAQGVHLNGLVRRADGLHLWVGRRAADKLLDPGKLDHLAAGGIPAGFMPDAALTKEAEEECGLPAALVPAIRPAGTIRYAMRRREGLRRDVLHCYDIDLPEDFTPEPVDGEVESFALWPLHRVFETVRDQDSFKFNVNLVLIDLFLRQGLIDPRSAAGRRLREGLDGRWVERLEGGAVAG